MYGYEIFHENIMNTLIDNVRNSKNAATYIFCGPKGLGKHSAARLLAQALVCDDPRSAPCGRCSACREAGSGNHPDIITVVPEKDKKEIGIDTIRAMIKECLINPFYDRHKVFIIDDGDAQSIAAQNAFLKIIEEPPEYAVFIIVCTELQTLLETVRSRSVIVNFPPVSDNTVRKYIEEKHPDEPRVDFLVRYCAGIPKTADSIISDGKFEQNREESLNIVPKLLSKNKRHAYDFAKYIDDNKADADAICDMTITYLRDALMVHMGASDKIINSDKSDKINLLAQSYTARHITRALDEMLIMKKMLNKYVKVSAAALHAALKTI